MTRTTTASLQALCDKLNTVTGAPLVPFVTASFKSHIGCYYLHTGANGLALYRMVNEHGLGEDALGSGHVPKRELEGLMRAYIKGMEDCIAKNPQC